MKPAKLVLPILLTLVGCQSTPYAVIDGGRKVISDDNNYEVRIKAIDGKLLFSNNIRKNIKPGPHLIVLETTKKHRGRSETTEAYFPIEAKPCTKYRVSAQYKNSLSEEWEIKLIDTSKIPSCEVGENKS
ncbi:hypothetical protein PspMM1_34660 [Pseudoalteromonas sp. MM1]|uniref:hypothetical protein n=1 Tax=Pseudoalteromonas sp. MM1 TaxID=3036714 RepID=UPI002573798D|nr:hypothetical protein [Pseudoalteromonas sp. MM1]BED90998.1 hypothetical protein PspMM1_34660 [Pseudoalteromonas sp. MM1]